MSTTIEQTLHSGNVSSKTNTEHLVLDPIHIQIEDAEASVSLDVARLILRSLSLIDKREIMDGLAKAIAKVHASEAKILETSHSHIGVISPAGKVTFFTPKRDDK